MTEQDDRVEISFLSNDEDSSDIKTEDSSRRKKSSTKKRPGVRELQKEIKELKSSLDDANQEKDEYKDKYLRNLAEIDNFRKRVKKEKEDYQKYVLSEFLLDLLQVYDNLERALKAKTSVKLKESEPNEKSCQDEKSIISGVEMIYKQFSDLLKKYNVEEIDALGRFFDPNVHQALSKEERDGITDPTVIEVYQKGFLYNKKLLKPTLVKVAIPKEEKEEEPIMEADSATDEKEKEELED